MAKNKKKLHGDLIVQVAIGLHIVEQPKEGEEHDPVGRRYNASKRKRKLKDFPEAEWENLFQMGALVIVKEEEEAPAAEDEEGGDDG